MYLYGWTRFDSLPSLLPRDLVGSGGNGRSLLSPYWWSMQDVGSSSASAWGEDENLRWSVGDEEDGRHCRRRRSSSLAEAGTQEERWILQQQLMRKWLSDRHCDRSATTRGMG